MFLHKENLSLPRGITVAARLDRSYLCIYYVVSYGKKRFLVYIGNERTWEKNAVKCFHKSLGLRSKYYEEKINALKT